MVVNNKNKKLIGATFVEYIILVSIMATIVTASVTYYGMNVAGWFCSGKTIVEKSVGESDTKRFRKENMITGERIRRSTAVITLYIWDDENRRCEKILLNPNTGAVDVE